MRIPLGICLLALLNELPLGAQQAAAGGLRQEVRGGPVLRVIATATPQFKKSAELINGADLIVVGEVLDDRARLTEDGAGVFTDYTVELQRVIADASGRVAPGQRLTLTRPGGQLHVEGVAVNFETLDFPPLPWLVAHLLFLREDGAGRWRLWGGVQGVWRLLPNGRVRSHLSRPQDMWVTLHFNQRELEFVLKEIERMRRGKGR